MYMKKEGSALISSIIFLFIISTLGICIFKNMESNVSIQGFQNIDIDIYDLDYDEAEIIKKFMDHINDEAISEQRLFDEETEFDIEESSLKYCSQEGVFFLNYKKDNIFRRRKINYKLKDEKIILIPSYTYTDKA